MKIPFDDAAARAVAVVECVNHGDLFNQTRNIAGPVSSLPKSQIS